MELWIRSQDKEMLYKVHEIFYYRCTDAHSIQVNHENFGTYKTKERALEVLNEIQDRLINLQNYGKITGYCRYEPPCVYEMPQE